MKNEFPSLRMGILGALLEQEQEKTPFETYKLKLAWGENVFGEPTLSRIRHWSLGRQIVVVDAHGVLMDRKTNVVYPDAGNVVRAIKKRGYTPVLWSYGGSMTQRILEREDWYKCFGMTIYADHYSQPPGESLLEFVQLTPQTPKRYQNNPLRLRGAKNPDLFDRFTVVLDDALERHYPTGLLQSKNHAFVQILPRDADIFEQVGRRVVGDRVFDMAILERIDEAFEAGR